MSTLRRHVRYPCVFCDHSSASESAWDDHRRSTHPRPRRDFKGPLAPYLTHASAFGVDGVFEIALADPLLARDPQERVSRLALLGKRLKELDRRWKAPMELDVTLLHDQGHDPQAIADLLGVARGTVQRRIRGVVTGPGPDISASQTPENTGVLAAFLATPHPYPSDGVLAASRKVA